jgi:hypothetical protein
VSACFEHKHMTPTEFALWNLWRALAHPTGLFEFTRSRDYALMFDNATGREIGQNIPTNVFRELQRRGWIKQVSQSFNSEGRPVYEYRILTHAEWVKSHPEGCAEVEAVTLARGGDRKVRPMQLRVGNRIAAEKGDWSE